MPMTCLWNPMARVPTYVSCAQYLDCTAQSSTPGSLPDYLTECPYPQLFSTATGQCEQYYKVRCMGRAEPKAPCDYIQYQQLCVDPRCPKCETRHPSCVGRSDGNYLVPKSSRTFFVCQAERTINIGRCDRGYTFSESTRRCQKNTPHEDIFPTSYLSSSSSNKNSSSTQGSTQQGEIRVLLSRLMNLNSNAQESDHSSKVPAMYANVKYSYLHKNPLKVAVAPLKYSQYKNNPLVKRSESMLKLDSTKHLINPYS